jgi:hypothetical protein
VEYTEFANAVGACSAGIIQGFLKTFFMLMRSTRPMPRMPEPRTNIRFTSPAIPSRQPLRVLSIRNPCAGSFFCRANPKTRHWGGRVWNWSGMERLPLILPPSVAETDHLAFAATVNTGVQPSLAAPVARTPMFHPRKNCLTDTQLAPIIYKDYAVQKIYFHIIP